MHGGMKVYAGPPAAARQYLEADRGRADDYYLAEGSGLARRFTARDERVPKTAPPPRSSAGSPGTRPPGSVRAAARYRYRWMCWRR